MNQLIKGAHIPKIKFLKENGLGKNALYIWEERENIPKHNTLKKIADYFNVSIDYLLGKTNNPQRMKALDLPDGLKDAGVSLTVFSEDDFKKYTEEELRTFAFRALQEIDKRKTGK